MKKIDWKWAILYFAVIWFTVGMMVSMCSCRREYSCENCRDTVVAPIDTIITPDTLVIPERNMVSVYNFYIADNKEVKVIYVEYTSTYHPDTYLIFSQVKVDSSPSVTYMGLYNLMDYLPINEKYYRGDTFRIRYEVRYKYGDVYYFNEATLIY